MILSFYGGGFATAPAYLRICSRRLSGGAIHGRLLTAWSAAGVAGRDRQRGRGAPHGRGRPGPEVYTTSLLIMVGVLAVGFVANLLIKPVAARYAVKASAASAQELRPHGATAAAGTLTRRRPASCTRSSPP